MSALTALSSMTETQARRHNDALKPYPNPDRAERRSVKRRLTHCYKTI